MKMYQKISIIAVLCCTFNIVQALDLSSTDIVDGGYLTQQQVYNGFGCSGQNISPMLTWENIPESTEYFAVTVFDPDAPTGSGWWHWQIINIPKHILSLPNNTANSILPNGSMQMKNDFGDYGFGGACPPEGHGKHRYQFTVYALSKKIDVPEDASGALVGYMLNANAIEQSRIEVLYERPSN